MNVLNMRKQRGLSMGGFLFGLVIAIFLVILGMKLVPAYMEYLSIKRIFQSIASDPAVASCHVNDVAGAFYHQATTQYGITSITGDDINCDNSNGTPVISADYSVKIPVAGNVSLVVDFHPSSAP